MDLVSPDTSAKKPESDRFYRHQDSAWDRQTDSGGCISEEPLQEHLRVYTYYTWVLLCGVL